MSFLVTVEQRVPPERLVGHLDAAHLVMERSKRGRIHSRIFQSLQDAGHLLSVGEWEGAADFEQFLRDPVVQAEVVRADPPARISTLRRLRLFQRMGHRIEAVACVIATCDEEEADGLEDFVLSWSRREIDPSDGLVSEEVYRMGDRGVRFLIVHGWRTLEHLERFRASSMAQTDAAFAAHGVSMERFMGRVAAEFRRPPPAPPGSLVDRPFR